MKNDMRNKQEFKRNFGSISVGYKGKIDKIGELEREHNTLVKWMSKIRI